MRKYELVLISAHNGKEVLDPPGRERVAPPPPGESRLGRKNDASSLLQAFILGYAMCGAKLWGGREELGQSEKVNALLPRNVGKARWLNRANIKRKAGQIGHT